MKKSTVKELTKRQRKTRSKRKTEVKRKVSRSLKKTLNRQAAMKAKKMSLVEAQDIVVSEEATE